jgi:hypothetical protein
MKGEAAGRELPAAQALLKKKDPAVEHPTIFIVGQKTRPLLEVTRRLRNAGYEMVHEPDGKRAVKRMEARKFDAVVVPSRPDGMDRLEFARLAEGVPAGPLLIAKEGIPTAKLQGFASLATKKDIELHPRGLLVTVLLTKVAPR